MCTRLGLAQPTLVKDLTPGVDSSTIYPIVSFNGKGVFFTIGHVFGKLWITDGTADGTFDMGQPLTPTGYESVVCPVGENAYFACSPYDYSLGYEPWVTDGTPTGTQVLADMEPDPYESSYPDCFVAYGDKLLFEAYLDEDPYTYEPPHGYALFSYDPKEENAQPVQVTAAFGLPDSSYEPGVDSLDFWPSPLLPVGNHICFFSVNDFSQSSDARDIKLYRSDGTATGTLAIHTFSQYGEISDFGMPVVAPAGDRLYFMFYRPDAVTQNLVHAELWCSDATEAGTVLLKTIDLDYTNRPSMGRIVANRGRAYFFINNTGTGSSSHENTLWMYDDSIGSVQRLGVIPSYVSEIALSMDRVFFNGVPGSNPMHYVLWTSDGTADGTREVMDLSTTPEGDSNPANLVPLYGWCLFSANDGVNGDQVWITDGTAEHTRRFSGQPFTGSAQTQIKRMNVVGHELYLWANDGSVGAELYKMDLSDSAANHTVPTGNPSPIVFGDTGVTIDFDSNSAAGELEVIRYGHPFHWGWFPGYWSIHGMVGSQFGAVLVFSYDPAEVAAAGLSEAGLSLVRSRQRHNGQSWETIPATVNTATHTIRTVDPVSEFSLWTLRGDTPASTAHWALYE